MHTEHTFSDSKRLTKALKRLELLLSPDSEALMAQLTPQRGISIPVLSQQLHQSPANVKKQLDQLCDAGFVHLSKQYPNAYLANQFKCLRVKLAAEKVSEGV
ncbi:MAG: hypothetical protein R2795_14415 [Saprospiraceae bacterium]